MCYNINSDLRDRINLDRFEKLLKEHEIKVSKNNKNEICNIIENSINGKLKIKTLTVQVLDEFIANEVKYGKNRNLYISKIDKPSAAKMKNIELVQMALKENGFKNKPFNHLRTIKCPSELELGYLNFQYNDTKLHTISMCFCNTCQSINGISEYTNFIWADISPYEYKITTRIWVNSGSYFETQTSAKKLYDDVLGILIQVFQIHTVSADAIKGMLYKMYKNLTDMASKPFKEPLNLIQSNIDSFVEECVRILGSREFNIKSTKDPIDLPYRIEKLFERAMIQNHFEIYERHFEGKRGYVKRLNFSDATGANVNAKAAMDKSLEFADVFFDTRETLDDIRYMNKLWIVLYFRPNSDDDSKIEKIEVKIESFTNYYVIHILSMYLTKEVEDLVLSNLKYFETL